MNERGGATLFPECVVAGYKYRSHYRKSTHLPKDSYCTELKPAPTGIAQYSRDLLQAYMGPFSAESHKPTVSGSSEASAGAETRRVSPSDTIMHATRRPTTATAQTITTTEVGGDFDE